MHKAQRLKYGIWNVWFSGSIYKEDVGIIDYSQIHSVWPKRLIWS